MIAAPLPLPLDVHLSRPPSGPVCICWLGQAGFVIDGDGRRVVIDPYLSDSLADKYRGTRFDHQRMMPVPVPPGAIAHVDLVLATHAHTDHMDPGTLPALLAANPTAVLVAPAAVAGAALARAGLSPDRLIGAEAGQTLAPLPGVQITATRAAHEDLARDDAGRHLFLGYALRLGGRTVFHSGDTVPFDGQAAEVAALRADVALLPVNGRDATRTAAGVPGNLTGPEARALCVAAGIPAMIAHHFGMFAFNTASPADLAALTRHNPGPDPGPDPLSDRPLTVHPARLGLGYHWP